MRTAGNKDWRPFVYGGVASITAEFGTFPIDTTKTRLQIQGQKIDSAHCTIRYRGMIDAILKISKQEGINALYSGIWPAVLRQATYGTIKFGTYYTLKKKIAESKYFANQTQKESVRVNVFCAVVAGVVSSAIANPTDVIKVRLQVHGKGNEKSLFKCFYEVYQYEGIRGLWRGVGPTAQRAAVIAAVELPVYDFCKQQMMETFGDRVANHFISSFIASLGSAVASTPLDVIRTRLMNQRHLQTNVVNTNISLLDNSKIYKGSIDCAVQTVKNEGFSALYKGFIPTWVRMGPWNIIFFITYEQLKKLY